MYPQQSKQLNVPWPLMKRISGSFLVRSQRRILVRTLAWAIALWPALTSPGQQPAFQSAGNTEISPGLVVESVRKGGAAALSGIQPADILLGWSRGPSSGELLSPFDLRWVEAEQAPRGTIILTGRRGNEPRRWTIQPGRWEAEVRPGLPGDLLAFHQEALDLIARGRGREASARWLRLSEMAPEQPAWLRIWVKARAGKELYQANSTVDAERFYTEIEEACSLAGTEVCRQVLLQHAQSASRRGDFAAGEKYALRAVEKARVQQSPLALADTLSYLGQEITNRGDSKRAAGSLEEALKIQQELAPGSMEIARTLEILSLAAINNSDLVQAEQFASRSLAILESAAPAGRDIVGALNWLAVIAERRGDLVQEARYRRQMVRIVAEGERDPATLAGHLASLAFVLNNLGDLGEAAKYAQQARELIEAPENANKNDFARVLSLISGLEAQRGDWVRAEADRLRALNAIEEREPNSGDVVDILNAVVELYIQKSDFVRAMQYCRRAHELAVRLDPEGSQLASADYFCSHAAWNYGLVDEAETYFSEAAALLARSRPGSMDEADANAGLARVRHRQGRLAEAQELYEKALRSLDVAYARFGGGNQTRAGYRAELVDYYSDFVELLMQTGKMNRAFEVLELSRARALLELLNSAHVDLSKSSDPSLLEDLRRLQRQISAKSEERAALLTSKASETQVKALEKEISALAAQAGEVEGRIHSALPAYSAVTNPRPLSVHQAQELLDPDTLLLEYALGAERSYVFAVSAHSLHAFPLPGRHEIDKAARRIYSLLTARNQIVPGEQDFQRERRLRRAQAELPAALAELSRMVLGPLSSELGNKRLIVAADGALNYIPFAMLPEISPNSGPGGSAAPLVVRHEIVNLPSISVLDVLRRQEANRRPAGKAVAVFADPVFEKTDSRIKQRDAGVRRHASETAAYSLSASLLTRSAGDLGLSRNGQLSLPRLLFSRQEAEAIRAVTPPDQIKEAVDFQASRSAATSPELRNYRIVHFATHGLLNSEHPELSGLVLSLVDEHGQPQDGFLQLQDIYSLDLSADLVVLSACETGLGKEINGEGLIGLTRGFMHAGASRVVASLWKVSDVATAKLMAEFYRAMEKDHVPPAAALRSAQIRMWKQKRWASPYYWAAFQIQGEWK